MQPQVPSLDRNDDEIIDELEDHFSITEPTIQREAPMPAPASVFMHWSVNSISEVFI